MNVITGQMEKNLTTMINLQNIKNKINECLTSEITAEQLSDWATENIHAILKNNSLFLHELSLYPILCELQDVEENYVDYLTDFSHLVINMNKTYTLSLCIPKCQHQPDIECLKEDILTFLSNETWSNEALLRIETIIQLSNTTSETVVDVLRQNMQHLLSSNLCIFEDGIIFERSNILYPCQTSFDEKEFWQRILRLINCSLGLTSFEAVIRYRFGVPSIDFCF